MHFQNAYRLASGRIVKWTEAAVDIKDVSSVKCNTKAEYAELRKYMDEKGKELLYTDIAIKTKFNSDKPVGME